MLGDILVFGEIVLLSAALPLSVIAALGFRGSPFGKVTGPLPVVFVCYIVADGSRIVVGHTPPWFYGVVTSVALLAAIYAAVNAMLLLTERRVV
jgi:hypothetical protein